MTIDAARLVDLVEEGYWAEVLIETKSRCRGNIHDGEWSVGRRLTRDRRTGASPHSYTNKPQRDDQAKALIHSPPFDSCADPALQNPPPRERTVPRDIDRFIVAR